MRIAILTFHRAYNCGAMLQAWALQTVLRQLGYEVEFPDCNHVGERLCVSRWRKGFFGKIRSFLGFLYSQVCKNWNDLRRALCFRRFRNAYLAHAPLAAWRHYDLVVVGSDQVWNPDCAKEDFPLFIGEGIDEAVPLVGYALSVGDAPLDPSVCMRLKKVAANRFRCVSYREPTLKEALGVEGPVVCDPTLLLTREDYAVVEGPCVPLSERYIFAYLVSDAADVLPAAQAVAERMGLKLVVADVYGEAAKVPGTQNDCRALPPDQLLSNVRDAEYVIVSSFHGCVFSVLYQKRFVCLYGGTTGGNDEEGRQQNLLSRLGLLNHRLAFDSPVENILTAMDKPYHVIDKLEKLRTEAIVYLNEMVSRI